MEASAQGCAAADSTGLDADSAAWLAGLGSTGTGREQALRELHALLLRAARAEVGRRAARWGVRGPELDDLAQQAADDALVAITAKLGQFQGRSRFTTWAYKFVVLEAASKVGRHWWRHPGAPLDAADWERLPDRAGVSPDEQAVCNDLLAALHEAVETVLTPHQRTVFVAVVLDGVPVDALADRLGSTRNALYKALFDARARLRAELRASGHLPHPAQAVLTEPHAPGAGS